ncbi:MAG: aminotransferase class I/II-fold pyridoxal phosphate-dependent enzyme [Planctomycetota bacterium]
MTSELGRLNPNLTPILTAPYPFDVVDSNKKRALEQFPEGYVIDFGIGDPTDPVPDVVRRRMIEAVDELKCSGYPSAVGSDDFLAAMQRFLERRFGVGLEPDQLCAAYGAKYASFHLPWYFCDPGAGDVCLIPNPGYPPYTSGTLLAGAEPFYLNICEAAGFEPNLDDVPAEIADRARLLFVNSPHSPTGHVLSLDRLADAVRFCLDHDVVLVSDECYSELYYGEAPHSVLEVPESADCAIVLNSLSKRSMMTSCAVGFVASRNPGLLDPIRAITRKSVQGVANIIQAGAAAALRDEEHPEAMRAVYRERLDAIAPALEAVGCTPIRPRGTFFLWVKVPHGETPLGFSEWLLFERGINCVPGDLVSREWRGVNPGDGFVRFALVPDIEKVREAAERLTAG